MRMDNALANFALLWNVGSGDTCRRGAEYRSFLLLWFTHNEAKK
jgi:hypothetical protein